MIVKKQKMQQRMKRITIHMVFYLIIASPFNATAKTISIVADLWPPFNGNPYSDFEGYMVDITRAVFEAKGFEVRYIILPWTRAVSGTRSGIYTGIIGASKNDAKDFVFPQEELARNVLAFYVLKGNPWRFKGIDSIKNIKLGTIAGYDYRSWLNEYIQKNSDISSRVQIVSGKRPLQRNIRKLLAGRIDVIVDNEAAIRWGAEGMGVLGDVQVAGYGEEPSYCYIAFSPSLPESESYAELLSQGIVELRENGNLQKILDKYGLIDWKDQHSVSEKK